jgi:ectoine hydroxylase-related dioxygenase (phytanoyl-CoA dioxygenase family)
MGFSERDDLQTVEPRELHDVENQRHDIIRRGYCIIRNALRPEQVDTMAARLLEQSRAELAGGIDNKETVDQQPPGASRWPLEATDPTQWVSLLPNKGEIFHELLLNPPVYELGKHFIGEACIVSDCAARITKSGSPAMRLHTDQWWMPKPVMPFGPRQPAANIERKQQGLASPEPANHPISPQVTLTSLYALVDIDTEMGPTRFVPGSHLSGGLPEDNRAYDEISPEMERGSAVVFDGRIWHGAAANRSQKERHTVLVLYTGPQFRQIANFSYGLRPEVSSGFSDEIRDVLGYRLWNGYGATEDYGADYASPGIENPALLKNTPRSA